LPSAVSVSRAHGGSGDMALPLSTGVAAKLLGYVKQDLLKMQPETFAMSYIFETVPKLFDTADACIAWKTKLAPLIDVDPFSIILIGSAATAISLNPHKNFRPFDADGRRSDIDVAVVSAFHFEIAWRYLRDVGAKKYQLSTKAQASLESHRQQYIYWGTIATESFLHLFPFGKQWTQALGDMAKVEPTLNREIKIRLYRDSFSLVSYHVNNIRSLRRDLASN
jgi:hypothetical protein